jgi:calcineurin-like phosphoesterase family protein
MGVRSASALALMLAIVAPAAMHAKSDTPDYTYVVLGAQGPIARAIYRDTTDCPSIKADGTDQPMNARMGDKTAFPILVCEFLVPAGTKKLELKGKRLPLPPGSLESVAVIGDTGCLMKGSSDADNDSNTFQDCDKVSDWPFSQLAASVAKRKPQVLVHVGDYIYREVAPYGDNWNTWMLDFFKPAKPLLEAAPWIATRGNHEICCRNGAGFMLFLDTTLAQDQKPAACKDLLDPVTVSVGGQQFTVIDSSFAPDELPTAKNVCSAGKTNPASDCPSTGCTPSAYASQFSAIAAGNPTNAWLVSHRPVWGFKNKSFKKDDPLNATLQGGLAAWNGQLPPGLSLAVAGHIHVWETMSFADNRSPQFVLGNGGTQLGHDIKNKKFQGAKVGGTTVSYGYSVDNWGFTIFTPKHKKKLDGNWTATFYSTKGNNKFSCKVTPTSVSC